MIVDDRGLRNKDSHLLKKNLLPFGSAQTANGNSSVGGGHGHLSPQMQPPFHSPQKQTRLPPLITNNDKGGGGIKKLSVAQIRSNS